MSPVSLKLSFPSSPTLLAKLGGRVVHRWTLTGCLLLVSIVGSAQDLHIHIPKRSKPTPVQKLNQDGVKAIQGHEYEKAKKIFYKAYLIDPNDPFTLNNLGYIAELDGDLDRAQRFYALAAEQPSEAVIEKASDSDVKGKEVADVAGSAVDQKMEINRSNVYAIGLLMKDRAPEADLVLEKALKLDPKNSFTLNNLGFAKEKEGELEDAEKYYRKAASTGSDDPVLVTMNKNWRGKPIREISADNAKAVQKVLERGEDTATRIARLNLRGVSAINRNERRLARQYFEEAYKLDPNNAFTLNNMGYLAETDGDRETAEFFYAKAREGRATDARVALATRRDMEGQRMGAVAAVNDQTVMDAQQRDLEARRRQGGIVALMTRKNTRVVEPAQPVHPTHSEASDTVLIPRDAGVSAGYSAPSNGQTILETEPQVIPPLPENEQPTTITNPANRPPAGQPATAPPSNQPQVEPERNVIPPLPDNQQPPNATGQPTTPPSSQQQAPQGGVIPPLPDNQQPPNAGGGQQQNPPQ